MKKYRFTLVELLFVIAIIAMLMSILLPSLKKCREKSCQITCTNNLRQMGTGSMMYTADNADWLPVSGYNVNYGTLWDSQLATYLQYNWENRYLIKTFSIFHCPSGIPCDYTNAYRSLGYSYNRSVCMNYNGSAKMTKIPKASIFVLTGDYWLNTNFLERAIGMCATNYPWIGDNTSQKAYNAFRHFRKMNIVFADCSVAPRAPWKSDDPIPDLTQWDVSKGIYDNGSYISP